MAKQKYKFNPESLSYDKVSGSFKTKVIRRVPSVFFSIFIAGLAYFLVFSYIYDSPKERRLVNENKNLLSQYEILNKKLDDISSVLGNLQYRDDNLYRTIFEVEPIGISERNAGFGGINRYKELEGYKNSKIIIESAKKLDIIKKKLVVQSKSYDEVAVLAKNKEKRLANIPAIQPILNKDLVRISSYYGVRNDPVYKGTKKFHHGIDFTASTGTPIYATGNGTIKRVIHSKRGYGNMVEINHGYGYSTLYAHMSRTNVENNQKVVRGEIIGFVGNTGKSVGPHLHYEVRKNGQSTDPINFFYLDLNPKEYDKMIELSAQEGGLTLD